MNTALHPDEMQRDRTWGGIKRTSTAELLEWHSIAAGDMPDADLTLLLSIKYADGTTDWCAGWFGGDAWMDCSTGGEVNAVVTHWAQVNGPAT